MKFRILEGMFLRWGENILIEPFAIVCSRIFSSAFVFFLRRRFGMSDDANLINFETLETTFLNLKQLQDLLKKFTSSGL